MKKIIKAALINSTYKRGIRDLNVQIYSHDKNNAGFEFTIKNEVDLSQYRATVLFDFQDTFAALETKGTIEGNVVNVKFDTDLITKFEEVIGYLMLDSDTNSLDVFKFKFNVVLSQIDRPDLGKRGFRYIKDQEVVDVITRSELEEEIKKLQVNGGIDLSNYLTTSVATETYATKQELGGYALKTELPSTSGLVTTEQLTETKNSVVEEINNKGYVTSTVAEETYAKKTDLPAPYNDSALVERVTNLENKTDRDTVYNDTEVKERLTTLENKAPVDLSNYALKSEIPTPYNDSELVQKIGQLEARVDKDTVYDDTPLKERVTALESKAIEGGAYDDTHLRERLNTLEAKQDKDTVYDDAPLKQRVEALETKVDKDTIYNDEEVKRRLTELENKPAVDTSHFITDETLDSKNYLTTTVAEETYAKKSEVPQPYNDSALAERVSNLENKTDNDTVYDDTALKERVTALESKQTTGGSVDTSNLVTKDELKNQHYVTQDSIPIPLYKEYTSDDFNEYSKQDYASFLISNTRLRGKVFLNPNYAYTSVSPLVYIGDGVTPKTAEYDAVLFTVASSLPDGYSVESLYENIDNKVTFLSNKNFSEVVPKEELKNIIREVGGTSGNIDTSHFITNEILESKGFLTTHQDISNLATREELGKAVTKEELEEKHYVTNEQISSTYATKSEIPQPYSDTELVKRITILENRQDNDTVYDDAELKRRVTALEEKPSVDTSNFVTTAVLESKGYLTTHQDISNLVTKQELHEATEIDYSNIVTTDELEAYAKKSELPAPYNDSALVSRVSALENKPTTQWEIHGTGMPNGVVEAEIGTTYVDKNKTNGALKWIKTTNGGNTGWRVFTGDTGWRTLPLINKRGNAKLQIRRINDEIIVKFDGLSWGWFGVDDLSKQGGNLVDKTIAGKQYTWIKLNIGKGNDVLPQGFRSASSLLSGLYGDLGDLLGSVYVGGTTDSNAIQLRYAMSRNELNSNILSQIRISPITFITDDEWPLQLP